MSADAESYRAKLVVCVSAAQILADLDLEKLIEDGQRALEIGCLLNPSAWIEKHEALEQDIEVMRAALPLAKLGKRIAAARGAK